MSYARSNLYASRIYAEHPVALWAMDEPNYFISLISQQEKNVKSPYWTFDNAVSSSELFTLSGYPFDDLEVNKIYLATASAATIDFTLSLTSPIPRSRLDLDKGSMCVSSYIYIPEQTSVLYAEIGFIVDGEEFCNRYSYLNVNIWEKISYTIQTSDINYDPMDPAQVNPFIRVVFSEGTNSTEQDSSVYFNGFSLGQWSEAYNSISTGTFATTLPSSVSNLIDFQEDPIKCTVLDPYGYNDSDNGYVISLNNSLLAHLSGTPMVYGSMGNLSINKSPFRVVDTSTEIYAEYITNAGFTEYISMDQYDNFPSLVFPGKGFLNQTGYNKTLTAEFWIRINPEESTQKRIFGPLSSSDGIYVDKEFIKINVGKYTKSYFIGKWYRPMLLHFCQSPSEIFLMINGEKVISIPIDSLVIDSFSGEFEDFLGFYTDEKIYLYEIDSFSIFPYIVAEQVAKKRYVFGQGVQEQENIIASYNGNLSYVDFPFSGYSSTVKYPDRSKWESGFYNNLIANNEGISFPKYQLPQLIFNNTTTLSDVEKSLITSSFYEQNHDIQDEDYPFIVMDPSEFYISNGAYGTIYFSKINQTNYQTRSIHSILKSSDDVSTRQSLIYISNSSNSNVFEVAIESGSVQYLYNESVLNSASIGASSYFAVGIDFNKIEQTYYSTVGSFFSQPESLSLNFAGNQEEVFLGKIFSLTVNNDFFTDKDGSQIFNTSGLAIKDFDSSLYDYVGSYTLLPKVTNTAMILDIGISGYWENSIPLSYFGKNITQSNGDLKYDLDLLQFNIDTPSSIFLKYDETSLEYENSLSTKVYVTLQNMIDVGQAVYTQFTNTEDVGASRVLDLGEITSPKNTKYRINDGTIIYPPKDVSGFTNYYITLHIEMSSKGIYTEDIKIKNMGIASIAFDESEFYSINTPAAGKFYPIIKNEDQYVYKRKIPVVIDTDSSPYLYLSGDSGIGVLPDVDGNLLKGLSIPINETLKSDQEVVGMQMFLMYNESNSFTERKKIGKIFSPDNSFDIVLVPEEDGKRAFFKVFNTETGRQLNKSKFFLNGIPVSEVVIQPLIWNYISISFEIETGESEQSQTEHYPIYLDGVIGQIEIYSGVKVDNVASFIELNSVNINLVSYDAWSDVDQYNWSRWSSSATWTEALNEDPLGVTILSLNGEDIFNTYAGLSSGIANDNSVMNVTFDSVVILNDIDWNNYLV